ncbi:MAG: alpha/beta hydrolase family protein [Nocardioidaceae bacterium]
MTTGVREVATPQGPARIHTDRARRPAVTVVLGHGAGNGIESRDLVALAAALPRHGISVFRIEQPWRLAGRRVAPRPQQLDEATLACVNAIRVRTPMVLGGRSAGARVACRLARSVGAVGALALAFPLQPSRPGAPSRLPELLSVGLPTLVVQGERDMFGPPGAFPPQMQLAAVTAADHGFAVPRGAEVTQTETLSFVAEAVVTWVNALVR